MRTPKEVKAAGREQGYAIATWTDTPALGERFTTLERGKVEITAENQREVWEEMAHELEHISRSAGPLVEELEELEGMIYDDDALFNAWYSYDFDPFAAFAEGVTDGIFKEGAARFDSDD